MRKQCRPGYLRFLSATLRPGKTRIAGWVMLALGLFMVALMALVGALISDVILLSDIIPGTYRDENAPPSETPVGAYVFVGFCLLFGWSASWRVGIKSRQAGEAEN